MPEAKLCLDGYPVPSGVAADADKVAGFTQRQSLRLLLYPNALRFFWGGLHEPLRKDGAWPTATRVMLRGFVLEPPVRIALEAKLDALAPSSGNSPWCAEFRAAIRERHWAPSTPQQAAAMPMDSSEPSAADLLTTILHAERAVAPRLNAARSSDKSNWWVDARAAEAAAYRLALETARHPLLTPDRIDRLVARCLEYSCDECGCLDAHTGYRRCMSEGWCACGAQMGYESFRCADICPSCEQDPWTSVMRCRWCGEEEWYEGWRENDVNPADELRSACNKCHANGATPEGCQCGCIEAARRRREADATAVRRKAAVDEKAAVAAAAAPVPVPVPVLAPAPARAPTLTEPVPAHAEEWMGRQRSLILQEDTVEMMRRAREAKQHDIRERREKERIEIEKKDAARRQAGEAARTHSCRSVHERWHVEETDDTEYLTQMAAGPDGSA